MNRLYSQGILPVDLDAAAHCIGRGRYQVGAIAEMRAARQAAVEERVRLHVQWQKEHRANLEWVGPQSALDELQECFGGGRKIRTFLGLPVIVDEAEPTVGLRVIKQEVIC